MGLTRTNSQDILDGSVSGADLATGSQGQLLSMTGSVPSWRWPTDMSSAVSWCMDDFLAGTISGTLNWVSNISPSGSLISLDTGSSDANHPGVIKLSTGPTALGKSALINNSSSIVFGSGITVCEMVIQMPALSTPTDRFNAFVGFGDNPTSGAMVDGLYFRYGDELNGGQWQALLANNNTITISNSLVSASTAWTRLRIETDSAGTTGSFFINGALAMNVSGAFPNTAARATGLTLKVQKTAGTTPAVLLCDYVYFAKSVTR